MDFNINAWNLLSDGKTRVLIQSGIIEKVRLSKVEEELVPKWFKIKPVEIIKLMDDGIRYRKLKELKQIEKEMG